jgi:putative ATPase
MAAAVAHNAWIAANSIGRPEADIVMAHAVLLIATAPRNKAAANAIWSVVGDIKKGVRIPVPDPLKDTHYPGAKKLGRGSYQDGHKQVDYIGIDRKYYRD